MAAARARWRLPDCRADLVAALALLSPLLTALAVVFRRDDEAIGDVALIELRTRDVFSSSPPLTGAYSRYGWSHPGPLLFFAFAVPYRLFGADPDALRLAALLVNLVFLAVLVWLVRRRGEAAMTVIVLATAALVWGMVSHSLSDPWNVTIAMIPMVVGIVGGWAAIDGDPWGLPIAAVAVTFVGQAHVGFGVVVVPLFLVTFAAVGVGALRRGDRSSLLRSGLVVAGSAVLVVPVLYDLLVRWPGNVGRLVKWSLTNDEPKVGWTSALQMIGRTSSLSFPPHPRFPGVFVAGIEEVAVGVLPGTSLVALVVAAVVAWRRGWGSELRLCVSLGVVWVAGTIAAARITRPLAPWLIDWLQPLGWMTWAAVVLVAWRALRASPRAAPAGPRVEGAAWLLAVAVVVAGSIVFAHREWTERYLSAELDGTVDAFAAAVAAADLDGPVQVSFEGEHVRTAPLFQGLVARLEQEGVDACVRPELSYQFDDERVCPAEVSGALLVRNEPRAAPAPAGAEVLAVTDPLTADERARADRLRDDLAALLLAGDDTARVPLLDTPFVAAVLDSPSVASSPAASAQVEELAELGAVAGSRYGLYLTVGSSSRG